MPPPSFRQDTGGNQQPQPRPSTSSARLGTLEQLVATLQQKLEDQELRLGEAQSLTRENEDMRRRISDLEAAGRDAAATITALKNTPVLDLGPLASRVDQLAGDVGDLRQSAAQTEALTGAVLDLRSDAGATEQLAARQSRLEQALAQAQDHTASGPPPPDLGPLQASVDQLAGEVAALKQGAGTVEALQSQVLDLRAAGDSSELLAARQSRLEEAFAKDQLQRGEAARHQAEDADKLKAALDGRLAALADQQAAKDDSLSGQIDLLLGRINDLDAKTDTSRGTVVDFQLAGLSGQLSDFMKQLLTDPVLGTIVTSKGIQVPNSALVTMDAAKLTGAVATAALSTNIMAAWNGVGTGAAAGVITTGDLAQAVMVTNVIGAFNASAGGGSAAQINTGTFGAGARLPGNQLSGDLTLLAGQKIGAFGATAVTQRTRGGSLTNNIVSFTGTVDQIDDLTGVYAADFPVLAANMYQLGRIIRQYDDGLRPSAGYGLFT